MLQKREKKSRNIIDDKNMTFFSFDFLPELVAFSKNLSKWFNQTNIWMNNILNECKTINFSFTLAVQLEFNDNVSILFNKFVLPTDRSCTKAQVCEWNDLSLRLFHSFISYFHSMNKYSFSYKLYWSAIRFCFFFFCNLQNELNVIMHPVVRRQEKKKKCGMSFSKGWIYIFFFFRFSCHLLSERGLRPNWISYTKQHVE